MNISLNRYTAIGNLTQDPSYNTMPQGGNVCNFGMAINSTFKTKGGETKEDVLFIDIEVFGQQAVNCRDFLHTGAQVYVEGQLKTRPLTGGRVKYFCRADRILFLRYRSKDERQIEKPDNAVAAIQSGHKSVPVEDDIPF